MTTDGRKDIDGETRFRLSLKDWAGLLAVLLTITAGFVARDSSLRSEITAAREDVKQLRADFKDLRSEAKVEAERSMQIQLRIERLSAEMSKGKP